jgi:hypothetical protein
MISYDSAIVSQSSRVHPFEVLIFDVFEVLTVTIVMSSMLPLELSHGELLSLSVMFVTRLSLPSSYSPDYPRR